MKALLRWADTRVPHLELWAGNESIEVDAVVTEGKSSLNSRKEFCETVSEVKCKQSRYIRRLSQMNTTQKQLWQFPTKIHAPVHGNPVTRWFTRNKIKRPETYI